MITVQFSTNYSGAELSEADVDELVRGICERLEISDGAISVAVVDDGEFRELNKRFLNRDGTSDCLSFDLSDESGRDFSIVVNGEVAASEARSRKHSARAELALYIVHGMLHNLGFDDSTDSEAERMHRAEDEILGDFGYGVVYKD